MDWELREILAAREAAARQREIDAVVAGRLAATAVEVKAVSDETLLHDRAVKFGQALTGAVDLSKSRRPWVRSKAKRLVEPFADVRVRTIPENDLRVTQRRLFEQKLELVPRVRRLTTTWEGWRTQPINDAREVGYQFGWQVGKVSEVIKNSSARKNRTLATRFGISTPDNNTIRIWRTATRFESGAVADEESQLAYELDTAAGRVTSYTAGELDDPRTTVGKDAGPHVLSLLGRAINFLES